MLFCSFVVDWERFVISGSLMIREIICDFVLVLNSICQFPPSCDYSEMSSDIARKSPVVHMPPLLYGLNESDH